ncbi:MAG: C-terminal binding protein [bacterium]
MKIVINYQEYADVEIEKAVLRELPGVEIVESRTRNAEEFISEVRDADAAIVQYAPCTEEVIAAMTRAKVIVRYGIAVDNIDLAAANDRGIRVCHVPFYCLDEVSNHALALFLALHRKLFDADRLLREDRHRLDSHRLGAIRPIPRLSAAAAGLLGFGHIARRLAEKLKPLFAEVAACDPFVSAEEMAEGGARKVEIDELFSESDFISIHAPLTEATRHLVGAELISKMKPTAILVNTSRGAVVDEALLAAALKSRKIAGAGLDVFETEPLPADSPLRALDNVIITGHCAWYSEGAIKELKETAAREALRVLRGEEPRFEVVAR